MSQQSTATTDHDYVFHKFTTLGTV